MLQHSNRLFRKRAQFLSLEAIENRIDKEIFIYREKSVSKRVVVSSHPFMSLCDFLDWIFFFFENSRAAVRRERTMSCV